MTTKQLTQRDREILFALTHRVRVMTIPQIARTWFVDTSDPERATHRRLGALQSEGLIERLTLMAHPELLLEAPVFEWRPGGDPPDLGRISYQLKSRWTRSVKSTAVAIATRAANHRLGGYIGARRPRRSEATHDIHLAQVYLWFRNHHPQWAKRWVSEHEQYAAGGGRNARLPDAIIRGRNAARQLIVEFGGAYSKPKLVEFHEAFSSTPYQLW